MNKGRIITTHEGRFLNVEDIREALKDESFMLECAAMLKVGREKQESAPKCMAHSIGYCIMVLTGELERLPEGTVVLKPLRVFYNLVFDILVNLGGAPESMREDFMFHQTGDSPPDEYRFQGKLGFGGKYWRHNNVVSCYVEDETVVVRKLIQDINEALVKIPRPAA